MFSSSPGLYPLDARSYPLDGSSNSPLPSFDNRSLCSKQCPMSPKGQNLSQWEPRLNQRSNPYIFKFIIHLFIHSFVKSVFYNKHGLLLFWITRVNHSFCWSRSQTSLFLWTCKSFWVKDLSKLFNPKHSLSSSVWWYNSFLIQLGLFFWLFIFLYRLPAHPDWFYLFIRGYVNINMAQSQCYTSYTHSSVPFFSSLLLNS